MTFDGKFYQLEGREIRPYPFQNPHPRFYLGGGSRQAWEISAKHSDVHLFWGDTYERIRANMAEIKTMAAAHGRQTRSASACACRSSAARPSRRRGTSPTG